ncbi:hypothetical protein WDU94_003131 [Cyamophila willieti]
MDKNPIPTASQTSLQYDIELGGKTELPFVFNVEEYVAGHIEELKALNNAIENPTKTKLAFQRLPKHMRRRVMSHNVKRMPTRLREAHAKYLQKQNLKTPHRPTRKYRRRPSNMLAEYNRRAKRVAWLETHIWHAKRFTMVEAWGYKLAQVANEKSYRASVRALDRHCLLQDISYFVCLELSGPESLLIQGLSAHFDSRACFTPGAKIYRAGTREGNGMFYANGRYPYGAIGSVRFLWRPTIEEGDASTERTLWLWCHPSYYQTVRRELMLTFSLDEEEQMATDTLNQGDETSTPSEINPQPCPPSKSSTRNLKSAKTHPQPAPTKKKKPPPKVPNANVELEKLALRNIPHSRTPAHSNVVSGVRMRLLKDVLNRFELRGPLSGAVIARALNLFTSNGEQDTPPNVPLSLLNTTPRPEQDSGTEEDPRLKLWRLLRSHSPSQFPPRVVLGAVVRDPRFNMPAQRTRNEMDTPESDDDIINLSSLPSPSLATSPLWDPDLRDWVSTNKPSTHSINTLFSTRLVPGVPKLEELSHALPIPLLFIQQEGVRRNSFGTNYKKIGFGSGWDMIFPAGWSMPLLLGLIFNGARVGGLREASQLSVQMRSEPPLTCDTRAWRHVEDRRSEEARDKYFRKPPKKRPNFIRLGNATPFSFPWTVLLRDWHKKHPDNTASAPAIENDTMDIEEETMEEMIDEDDTTLSREHGTKEQRHGQTQGNKVQKQQIQKQSEHQQKHAKQQQQKQSQKENLDEPIENNNFYVLRDKQVIEKLNTLIDNINRNSFANKAGKGHILSKAGKSGNSRLSKPNNGRKDNNSRSNIGKDISTSSNNFDQLEAEILNNVECRDDCLVQVNVQIIKRGTMDKYAHICLPSEAELVALSEGNRPQRGFKGNNRSIIDTGKSRKNYQHHVEEHLETKWNDFENVFVDNTKNNNIQEAFHKDVTRLARKTLKDGHKKLLLRLKRRRVRAKKRGSEEFENPKRVKRKGVHPTKELVQVYQEVMRKLWIPDVEELEKETDQDKENIMKEERGAGKEGKFQENIVLEGVKKQVNEAKAIEERLKKTNISVDEQVKNYLEKVSRNIKEENSGGSCCHEKVNREEKKTDSQTSGEFMKERKRCLDDAKMDLDDVSTENTPKRKKTENSKEFTLHAPWDTVSKEKEVTELKCEEKELLESKSTEKAPSELQNTEKTLQERKSTLQGKTKLQSYDSDVTDRILSRLQPIRSLRFVASHELFGFVTSSSFHSTAQYGQGCVTLNGLMECVRRGFKIGGKVRVLLRRSSDVNYHWAEISVV